jgi:hypothetical protein
VAVAIAVATIVAIRAIIIEEEVAAGIPLDHGEVLELLSQPVDPEGECNNPEFSVRKTRVPVPLR